MGLNQVQPGWIESPEAIGDVDARLAAIGLHHGRRATRAGSWSGGCVSKMKALSAALRGRPVNCVAITPETGGYPRRMKAQNQLDCIVLSDVDHGVGLLFGLIYLVPPAIVARMAGRGLDLTALHGATSPMLAAPAVYVVETTGKIAASRVDRDYAASLDMSQILTALPTGS